MELTKLMSRVLAGSRGRAHTVLPDLPPRSNALAF